MIATTYQTAAEFLQASQPFLETNEAANNLLLGICFQLKHAPQRIRTTPYLITVSAEQDLILAAVMTPPFNLIIYGHDNHHQAIETLVQRLLEDGAVPPGVLGPSAVAQRFAVAWANASGVHYKKSMRQRIYELRRVIPPSPVPGGLRPAAATEIDLITQWALDFQAEALSPGDPQQTRETVDYRTSRQEIYIWEDGQPVSLVAKARPISHGITINLVYTPPQFRRRGYAGSAVAALSQQLLNEGWQFCTLHTDLTNPTSNHIYQAIGYRPVCDFNEYLFDAQSYES